MRKIDWIKKCYYFLRGGSNYSLFLKGGGKVGRGCSIGEDTYFGSEPYLITIGDNVRITMGVRFFTHDGGTWVLRHMYPELSDVDIFGKIEIGNNVHIGAYSMIMPNVKIGNNCIIGCGTIVTKNVPDNSVVVGVPGRVIKTIGQYMTDNEKEFVHTKGIENKKDYILEQLK